MIRLDGYFDTAQYTVFLLVAPADDIEDACIR
jgi:hypothetical protein